MAHSVRRDIDAQRGLPSGQRMREGVWPRKPAAAIRFHRRGERHDARAPRPEYACGRDPIGGILATAQRDAHARIGGFVFQKRDLDDGRRFAALLQPVQQTERYAARAHREGEHVGNADRGLDLHLRVLARRAGAA